MFHRLGIINRKSVREIVLTSHGNETISLVVETYLFEEIIAWVIATLITISFVCLYAKYVSPEIWNYIVAFLFG